MVHRSNRADSLHRSSSHKHLSSHLGQRHLPKGVHLAEGSNLFRAAERLAVKQEPPVVPLGLLQDFFAKPSLKRIQVARDLLLVLEGFLPTLHAVGLAVDEDYRLLAAVDPEKAPDLGLP